MKRIAIILAICLAALGLTAEPADATVIVTQGNFAGFQAITSQTTEGYILQKATFVMPTLSCAPDRDGEDVSVWVGLGGNVLGQVGTHTGCIDGAQYCNSQEFMTITDGVAFIGPEPANHVQCVVGHSYTMFIGWALGPPSGFIFSFKDNTTGEVAAAWHTCAPILDCSSTPVAAHLIIEPFQGQSPPNFGTWTFTQVLTTNSDGVEKGIVAAGGTPWDTNKETMKNNNGQGPKTCAKPDPFSQTNKTAKIVWKNYGCPAQ